MASIIVPNKKSIIIPDSGKKVILKRAVTVSSSAVWYDAISPGSTDTTNSLNDASQAQPVIAGQSGNCTKLRIYLAFGNGAPLKMALYNSSFALLRSNTIADVGSVSDVWVEVTITSQAVTSGNTYWIASMSTASPKVQGRYLSGQPAGTSRIEFGTTYAAFPPDPFPAGDWTVTQCVGMYIEP